MRTIALLMIPLLVSACIQTRPLHLHSDPSHGVEDLAMEVGTRIRIRSGSDALQGDLLRIDRQSRTLVLRTVTIYIDRVVADTISVPFEEVDQIEAVETDWAATILVAALKLGVVAGVFVAFWAASFDLGFQ